MLTEKLFKLRIIGLKKNRTQTLDFLHKIGVTHISHLDRSKYKNILHKIGEHEYLPLISKYLIKLKWIKNSLEPFKDKKKQKKIKLKHKNTNLKSLFKITEKLIENTEEELKEDLNKKEMLQKKIKDLEIISTIVDQINLKDLDNLNKFKLKILTYNNKLQNLEEIFQKQSKNIILFKSENIFIIGYFENIKENIEPIIKKNNFENAIPNIQTLKNIDLNNITNKLIELKNELNFTNNKLLNTSMLNRKDILQLEYDLEVFHRRYTANYKLLDTKNTFLLSGYISEKDFPKLNPLKNNEDYIIEIRTAKNAPSKLTTKPYFKHFSFLTEMFGLPKYRNIDPTYIIAIFFPLFFGLMFSDIGYGLMLIISSIIFYKKLKDIKQAKDISIVFITSGLSTILFGFLFGSFFGNLVPMKPLLFDPFKKSIILLIIAIILGIIHLNIGLISGIFEKTKNKNYKEIFTEHITILLLEGTILSILLKQNTIAIILGIITIISFYIKGKLFGLMDITGYAGTVMSYARLLALSLATGGIALAINIMAQNMLNIPKIGPILMILLLIFGHTFNFVINLLGSSIHSIRLHYVELFSQFYNAEGFSFKPFKIEEDKKLI